MMNQLELGFPHLLPPMCRLIWQQWVGNHLAPNFHPLMGSSNSHPGGRTLQHLQANLGDLADNEL